MLYPLNDYAEYDTFVTLQIQRRFVMKRKHPANLFVRDCITKALFNLMKKKDYLEITVSEIVNAAGVSRNSFYRNYQSIEDIIRQHMTEQTKKWWDEYMANILSLQGIDKKKAEGVMRKVSEILMLGRSLSVRLVISCQRP